MAKKWGIAGFALLGLVACQTPQQEESTPTVEYVERPKIARNTDTLAFNYDLLASEIENYFLYFGSDSVLHQFDLVQYRYHLHNYQPHWIGISDTLQHAEFLNILAFADTHGLDRNTYHHDRLATNLENLSFLYFQTGEINYQLWAESEVLLADGLILLNKHLKQGVFNPLADDDYGYFIPLIDTVFEPFAVFYADSLMPFFQNLIPRKLHYKTLQNEYVKRLGKPEKSRTLKDIDTLNTLRVNLERWRWDPLFADSNCTVYINIPAFQLYVLKADSIALSSKICVGIKRPKAYASLYQNYLKNPKSTPKPGHNETPMLKSTISYLVLNPHWNVPNNIAKNEILRSIQKDSNFLRRMGYLVYRGDVLIDPGSIRWEDVSPQNLPYRFEQLAGDKNALGKMKFMFPNRFSVYLHDTPSKRDFSRRNRAVSHGCVRVENYLELAQILLADAPKYDLAYIRKAIGLSKNSPQKIKTVNLFFKTKIPIIIDYKTAWVSTSGGLQIVSDVYDRDKSVLEALQNQRVKPPKS